MLYSRKKYLSKVKPFVWKDIIKILVWQRRTGKSKLLFLIKENFLKNKKTIYIDMEQIENEKYKDYKLFYEKVKKYNHIFVDEVQNIENWEKAILSLQNQWKDIYLTWSNSKILSSELATNLRWRYIEFEIFPFDYKEFLEAFNLKNTKDNFLKYLKFGWLPYLLNLSLNEEIAYEYLKSVYSTIVLKDIVERYSIRNAVILEKLVTYLAKNVWNIFSGTNITKYLKSQWIKISTLTILQYLSYFKEVFLLKETKRYDLKWKKIFEVKEKYFFNDIWIRNAILGGFNPLDIAWILENVVAINLLSNWWKIYVGEYNNLEIDFVAEKNGKKIYIQVAYLISDEEVKKREFWNLLKIQDSRPKYVLSMDDIAQWEYEGIKWMKIRDFFTNFSF